MNYENVSIVIPTFNREKYLKNCIESCLSQTIPCEIIVCDHGSTDNTPELMKQYEGKVTYVRRELDSGVHFCWMDGILHAKHDLIHINFDDDWMEPTFIEKCLPLFDDNTSCVISNARIVRENNSKSDEVPFFYSKKTGKISSGELIKKSTSSLISPCAGIYRKNILIDNLFIGKIPFTKNTYHGVGPDILFSLMSTFDFPFFGYVNEFLINFRAHDTSITVDAHNNPEKQKNIHKAYQDARIYFYLNKLIQKTNLFGIATKILNYKQKKY